MEIYLGRNGQREGPYSVEEVKRRLAGGQVRPGDLAWHEGLASWVPIGQLSGLGIPPAVPGVGLNPPPLAPMPLPAPGSPAVAQVPAMDSFAITSLVFGVVGIFLFAFLICAVGGIVFGHLSLQRIRNSGGALCGRALAIAGLVISYLELALWLAIAGVVVWALVAASKESGVPPPVVPRDPPAMTVPTERVPSPGSAGEVEEGGGAGTQQPAGAAPLPDAPAPVEASGGGREARKSG